jgi:hypothetical protein
MRLRQKHGKFRVPEFTAFFSVPMKMKKKTKFQRMGHHQMITLYTGFPSLAGTPSLARIPPKPVGQRFRAVPGAHPALLFARSNHLKLATNAICPKYGLPRPRY